MKLTTEQIIKYLDEAVNRAANICPKVIDKNLYYFAAREIERLHECCGTPELEYISYINGIRKKLSWTTYLEASIRKKFNSNRHPHADMIHEWLETGRSVQWFYESQGVWVTCLSPAWDKQAKYRWSDEHPKPDVTKFAEITQEGVCWFDYDMLDKFKDKVNCEFIFDANGQLKNAKVLK